MMNNMHFKTVVICCAIILAVCSVLWDKTIFIVPIILGFIIFGVYKKYFDKYFGFLVLLFFTLTIFYTYAREPIPDILTYYDKQNITLEGNVSSLPSKSLQNKTKFAFSAKTLIDNNGAIKEIDANTQAFFNDNIKTNISRGDFLRIKANILVPKNFSNEGEFDYAKYLSNSNIFTLSFVDEVEVINTERSLSNRILYFIDNIREKIIIIHKQYLPEHKVEILGGIVFGSEAIKPAPELKNIFIESGLYHLLAASGMNVAFIFGIWFFLLVRLKVPYKIVIISGGIVVLLYALMTGLPPSVIRATWMLELGLLGKLLERKANNTVILLFVCAILLIYNPMMLNDIGFLLSFMVTFGLLTCTTPIIDSIKFIPAKISGWVVIPFIAQVFAIPIQMYYFQTFSLYAIFANMLVVPFMAIISFCGFVSSILALIPKIGTWICFVLDKANEPFLTFMYMVADKFSSIPNNITYVPKINALEIFLYYSLIFLIIYIIKENFKNIKANICALTALILLLCVIIIPNQNKDLSITFLNVGEADSIYIETPNKKHILVDTGRMYGKTRNSGTSMILPFLKVNGINHLDIMLLTHPDTDHIAGSADILKNIKVDKIITNGETANNQSYSHLKNYIKDNNLKEYIISKSENISPDKDVQIIALKPTNTDKASQNDTSIILLIKYKNFDGILMGDNEINSYSLLKKEVKPNGEIELFKIGHHASENSIDEKMSKFLSPKVTIISVGENSYGHPNPKVLSYLEKSIILRTDFDGAIKIKSNGEKFNTYTYNYQKSTWIKK